MEYDVFSANPSISPTGLKPLDVANGIGQEKRGRTQRRYRASGSMEHVSMERRACERRAPKQIKIGNPYSQICFPNFVGKKEEKSLIWTYYGIPYNRGLYGNLVLLLKQK